MTEQTSTPTDPTGADPTGTDPSGTDTSPDRMERFRSDVAGLAVPEAVPKQETYLLWGGIALVIVGVVIVFIGYWGASGTAVLAEQMPYMLSGGAIGLALVIVGAVLIGRYSMARLFRFWLALLVAEHRTQADRIVEALERGRRDQ